MFEAMIDQFAEDVVEKLFRVQVQVQDVIPEPKKELPPVVLSRGNVETKTQKKEVSVTGSIQRDVPKVGRNDECPCGSGKKYKKCHGA